MKANELRLLFVPLLLLCILLHEAHGGGPGSGADNFSGGKEVHPVYEREEVMRFEVRWLGLKAGEFLMRLKKEAKGGDRYSFTLHAKSTGLLDLFYPVDDFFETIIEGEERLPVTYLMDQKEGSRKHVRRTVFDQANHVVTYRKDTLPPQEFHISGKAHNEFSSFLAMRIHPLNVGKSFVVPTFADKKRHEVTVRVEAREAMDTIFGEVAAFRVRPLLKFEGLYEKKGAPVIWLTDTDLRVPVLIEARIKIGSLTATLIEYKRGQ